MLSSVMTIGQHLTYLWLTLWHLIIFNMFWLWILDFYNIDFEILFYVITTNVSWGLNWRCNTVSLMKWIHGYDSTPIRDADKHKQYVVCWCLIHIDTSHWTYVLNPHARAYAQFTILMIIEFVKIRYIFA
jgi:hypothetical protein